MLWVVGDRSRFNEQGTVPTNTTQRNILRQQDENDWHTGELIRLLADLAGLMHDLGKAIEAFQMRLQGALPGRNLIRHEWVSLRLFEACVRPEWLDYNGHMTESRYLYVFGLACDALFRSVGVDEHYRARARMFFSVETHLTHQAEALVNDAFYVTGQLLSVDDKRLRVFYRLQRGSDGRLLATGEQLYLHVDTAIKHSCVIDAAVRTQLDRLVAAHAQLPSPRERGRSVGMAVAR